MSEAEGSSSKVETSKLHEEYEKFFSLVEEIVKSIDKKESPRKEFRSFNSTLAGAYDKISTDFANDFLKLWITDSKFEEHLVTNDFLMGIKGNKKAYIDLRKCYLIAVEESKKSKITGDDDLTKFYPHIYLYRLANVINILSPGNAKIRAVIKMIQPTIDKLIGEETPSSGPSIENFLKQDFDMGFGKINFGKMLAGAGPQYQGMFEKFKNVIPKVQEDIPKLLTPDNAKQLFSGDFVGLMNGLTKDDTMLNILDSFKGVADPLIKQTAQYTGTRVPTDSEGNVDLKEVFNLAKDQVADLISKKEDEESTLVAQYLEEVSHSDDSKALEANPQGSENSEFVEPSSVASESKAQDSTEVDDSKTSGPNV